MTKTTNICYTKEMVQARAADRKRKTRRIIVPQPHAKRPNAREEKPGLWCFDGPCGEDGYELIRCPYGKVGDRLRVLEGYQIDAWYLTSYRVQGHYLADGEHFDTEISQAEWQKLCQRKFPTRATPSRFMYHSLARDYDVITEIRAERLQDISAQDAVDEGAAWNPRWWCGPRCLKRPSRLDYAG